METHPSFRVPRGPERIPDRNSTNPKLRLFYTTDPHKSIEVIDGICVVFFAIELLLRFIASPKKIGFFISIYNIVDIFCVLPMIVVFSIQQVQKDFWDDREFFIVISYLSLTSVLRVFRLFKLARHYRGLKILQLAIKSSIRELLLLVVLIFMGMLVFSTLIYFAEFNEDDNFLTIPIGFWWSIITMTTVGYGDVRPESSWGYLVGGFCAVSGMLATGLPIPIIANNFNHYYNYERFQRKLSKKTNNKQGKLGHNNVTPLNNTIGSVTDRSTTSTSNIMNLRNGVADGSTRNHTLRLHHQDGHQRVNARNKGKT